MKENPSLSYEYYLNLYISQPKPADLFTDEDKTIIESAIQAYNKHSMQKINPKMLKLEDFGETHFKIKLSSTKPLETPGRALRQFSAILLKNPRFSERASANGQLFKTAIISQPEPNATIKVAQVNDVVLIKSLIDFVFEKKDGSKACQTKRDAIEEIKEIAIKSGIITQID